jgi:hypothetical protein
MAFLWFGVHTDSDGMAWDCLTVTSVCFLQDVEGSG